MKTILSIFVAVLFSFGVTSAQERFANWPEMAQYHETLSQTFHPAEDGDLQPIKTRSHELYANCKRINSGKIPREFDNDRIREALKRLEKESDKLNAYVVRQEQNAIVMKQFKIVHGTFHEVVGICKEKN